MAMTKCKECGADVSSKAGACPKCGVKQPKPTSLAAWLFAGLFAMGIYQCTVGTYLREQETPKHASPAPASTQPAIQRAEPVVYKTVKSVPSLIIQGKKIRVGMTSDDFIKVSNSTYMRLVNQDWVPDGSKQSLIVTKRFEADDMLFQIELRRKTDPGPYVITYIYTLSAN